MSFLSALDIFKRIPGYPFESSPHHCNSCGRITDHESIYISNYTEYLNNKPRAAKCFTVRCRGCKTTLTYKESVDPGFPDQVEKSYIPPRCWAIVPKWLTHIEKIDPLAYGLLLEVYSATNDDQRRLLAMGIRAVLDHVMTRQTQRDIGGFEKKLAKMVEEKNISERQREMLEVVIDAGSAAIHRGYHPPVELLEHALSMMESVVRDHFITQPMLETVKTMIPPRPPSRP